MREILLQNYEKKSFTVTIPSLFSILQNPSFEVVSGSMIQTVKLFYEHNVVTRSIAAIFVYTYGRTPAEDSENI